MPPPSNNNEPRNSASSFTVTKHSWKGKYRRVLTVGEDAFSTYNPSSMEVTNSWKLADVVGMQPLNSQGDLQEFQVTFRKGPKKTDNMRFSSDWRATILTEGLRFLQLAGNEGEGGVTKVYHLNIYIFLIHKNVSENTRMNYEQNID